MTASISAYPAFRTFRSADPPSFGPVDSGEVFAAAVFEATGKTRGAAAGLRFPATGHPQRSGRFSRSIKASISARL